MHAIRIDERETGTEWAITVSRARSMHQWPLNESSKYHKSFECGPLREIR